MQLDALYTRLLIFMYWNSFPPNSTRRPDFLLLPPPLNLPHPFQPHRLQANPQGLLGGHLVCHPTMELIQAATSVSSTVSFGISSVGGWDHFPVTLSNATLLLEILHATPWFIRSNAPSILPVMTYVFPHTVAPTLWKKFKVACRSWISNFCRQVPQNPYLFPSGY